MRLGNWGWQLQSLYLVNLVPILLDRGVDTCHALWGKVDAVLVGTHSVRTTVKLFVS